MTVEALETNYKTPSSVNWSAGVRRALGWGTAVDVTYTGHNSYDMEMYYDLNGVPDGARFTDLLPANRAPTAAATPTAAALPAEFLRPYRGCQNIRVRGNFASGDYQSLPVQVNRRYIRGVQFGAAYTAPRARGAADEDPGKSVLLVQPIVRLLLLGARAEQPAEPDRQLLLGPAGRHTGPMRALLDGWQVSGEDDFVTGDWANVTFRQRAAQRRQEAERVQHELRDLFKNVNVGGSRAAQFRGEIYNLFNQVEFQDIDRTARFDANGNQINPNFGTAIGISNPTRPPRIVQLSLRLSF